MKTTADFVKDELRRQKDLPSVRTPFQPEDWERSAACAPVKGDNGEWIGSWDLFYAPEGLQRHRPRSDIEREAEAKALCSWCPVRELCRGKATDGDERFGIWGGMTTEERGVKPPRFDKPRTPEQRARATQLMAERRRAEGLEREAS
jgi:hypothetical protein